MKKPAKKDTAKALARKQASRPAASAPPKKLVLGSGKGRASRDGFVFTDADAAIFSFDNTPANNAMSAPMWRSLLTRVASVPDSKPIVFRTEDPRFFCTGYDLTTARFGDDEFGDGLFDYGKLLDKLRAHAQPVISLCQGATRGGGMLFPCISDIVVATEDATFGFPEVMHGGLPAVVSAAATHRMTATRCKYMMLTGRVISAYEAQTFGLVDAVVDAGVLEQDVGTMLRRLKLSSPRILALAKSRLPVAGTGDGLALYGELQAHLRNRVPAVRRPLGAESTVRVDSNGEGVYTLVLSNPRRMNMMSEDQINDMETAIRYLKTLPDLRAVVLRGEGRHFCAGLDPFLFEHTLAQCKTMADFAYMSTRFFTVYSQLREVEAPIIGVLHGTIIGGGVAMSMTADYRIGARDMRISAGIMPRGLSFGFMLTRSLHKILGMGKAFEFWLQNKEYDGAAALEYGIINEVADDLDDGIERAMALARKIAGCPKTGVTANLLNMRDPVDHALIAREAFGFAKAIKVISEEDPTFLRSSKAQKGAQAAAAHPAPVKSVKSTKSVKSATSATSATSIKSVKSVKSATSTVHKEATSVHRVPAAETKKVVKSVKTTTSTSAPVSATAAAKSKVKSASSSGVTAPVATQSAKSAKSTVSAASEKHVQAPPLFPRLKLTAEGFAAEIAKAAAAGVLPYHKVLSRFDTMAEFENGERRMCVGSNGDYHGMHGEKRVVDATIDAVDHYSGGSSGPHALSGYYSETRQLELELANFVGHEDAIILPMGFSSNLCGIPGFIRKGDYIFCDQLNHASIIDGCRESQGQIISYGNIDYARLEERLEKYKDEKGLKVIITDAIFSTTGKAADVPRLRQLADKYGALLVLDEAHSLGVSGHNGRGVEEVYNAMGSAHIKTGSIGKALGSLGGFISGSHETVEYIRRCMDASNFYNGNSGVQVAMARAALHVLRTETWRIAKGKENAAYFEALLKERGFATVPRSQESQIVAARFHQPREVALEFSTRLFALGFFVPLMLGEGDPFFRCPISSAFNKHELEEAADAFATVAYDLRIIDAAPAHRITAPILRRPYPESYRKKEARSDDEETVFVNKVPIKPFPKAPVAPLPAVFKARIAPVLGAVKASRDVHNDPFFTEVLSVGDYLEVARDKKTKYVFPVTYTGNYHNFINNAAVRQRVKEDVRKFSGGSLGPAVMTGYNANAVEVEGMVARLLGTEDAMVVAYDVAAISTFVGALFTAPADVLVTDAPDTSAIVMGARLAGCKLVRFPRNDAAALDAALASTPAGAARMLFVEAVHPETGAICDYPALFAVALRHRCMVAVDESHSLGVLGSTGRGLEEHYGMFGSANFKVGSFAEALGSTGGFIASTASMVTYLRYNCRGYVYSSTTCPANVRGAIEALRLLEADGGRLVRRLKDNARTLAALLAERGFTLAQRSAESGIIDVLLGPKERAADARKFSTAAFELGFLAPVLNVPEGDQVLRITACSAWSPEQMTLAADALAQAAFAARLIGKRPAVRVAPQTFGVQPQQTKKRGGADVRPLAFGANRLSATAARPAPVPTATLPATRLPLYDAQGLPANVGILAFEVYTPETCAVTADISQVDESTGLCEGHVSSFSCDHVDSVSLSMNALERLLRRYGVAPADVGRLEVGSETPVDHSKSIKTFLMPFFAEHDNHNIEGVELRSGAAAGTIALLDTVSWVCSPAWDGRYGIAIAVDDWESKPTRSGSVAVAMLVGPGAPIVVEPTVYGAFVGDRSGLHVRPLGWHSCEPVETGDFAREEASYEEALLACREAYVQRARDVGTEDADGRLVARHAYVALPGSSAAQTTAAFARLCAAEGADAEYAAKVAPCDAIANHLGYCGNAGLPLSLLSASLCAREPCRVLAFAFGCGSTGVLFSVRVEGAAGDAGRSVQPLLAARKFLNLLAYEEIHAKKVSHHRQFDWKPAEMPSTPGTWYMNYLRGNGSRTYARTEGGGVPAEPGAGFPRLAAHVRGQAHPCFRNAGLVACEAFAPARYVTMDSLEQADRCPGKYTKGLEMRNNAFCGDNEDAASAMINCVTRLLRRHGIAWDQVGRLDIGTETPTDAVKPLAAYVAGKLGAHNPAHPGSLPVIACDHTNACYANTAAVLSSIGWIQSPQWNGKYAVTVVADVSYAGVRYWAGYGCIALLLGPDANLVLEHRCSYHDHFWDFWKPEGWATLFPIVDGPLSMQNYIHAMTVCQQTFRETLGVSDLLKYFDFWVFHTTTPNFLRKVAASYYSNEIANGAEQTAEREAYFNKRLDQTMLLLKEVGLLYSVAVWANFTSLLATAPKDELVGKHISLFSFGSGATASMLCWKCVKVPEHMDHVHELVADRKQVAADVFLRVRQTYCDLLGKFDLKPTLGAEGVRADCYYLTNIDQYGGRTYEKCDGKDNAL